MRRAVPVAVTALAATAACAWLAARSPFGLDYDHDAAPAIGALAAGDLGAYVSSTPLMGSLSLILRAPFAALAGGAELLEYRLGSFVLLLALVALAAWLERLMAARGRPPAERAAVVALLFLNPVSTDALAWGHPEEALGAALCVAAVVAATRGRVLLAGLLLGLALATKQWAVLAVLPVLIACPRGRLRAGALAAAVVAALTLPAALADPEAAGQVARNAAGAVSGAGARVTALSVWWPFAEPVARTVSDGVGTVTVVHYRLPDATVALAHPLIVLLAVPLSALFWARRRLLRPEDALGLLALLLLLRCVLDPWDNQYYHLPFVVALAAWEGLRGRGLPVVSLATAAAMWLTFDGLADPSGYGATTWIYLGWALPLAAGIASVLYAPATVSALGKRLRISGAASVTTTRSSIRTPNSPAT